MISKLDHLIVAVNDLDEAESNYKKIFGVDPVWKGEHKELGTANVIFNFKNTYFELLSPNGSGLGADLVNSSISENGEGLVGQVFGTEDINESKKLLAEKGFSISEPSEGVGENSINKEIRKWKNIFYLQSLPEAYFHLLFSILMEASSS